MSSSVSVDASSGLLSALLTVLLRGARGIVLRMQLFLIDQRRIGAKTRWITDHHWALIIGGCQAVEARFGIRHEQRD